ncbi:MAG: phosphate signaling complex protein PhoU [Chromatiales bacterium]|jgi:phosphate transport system protein
MNDLTGGHIVHAFNDELNQINNLVLQLGDLGLEQLRRAVQSLYDEDIQAAEQIIERDRAMNELDIKADEEIIRLIAKRQPVAKDLRDVLTVQKTVNDLERVGDEARKVAGLTIHFYAQDKHPPNGHMLHDIFKMAEVVDAMLKKSLAAFRDLDLQQALEVIREDTELDEEYRAALRRLSTYVMEDARNVGYMVEVTLTLRALERIGGHAKNIGGYVIFLVTGRDVRHESLDKIRLEIEAGNYLPT